MVTKSLVDGGQNLFGDSLRDFERVLPIRQDLRLDDGHNAVHLTDGRVSGEHVGILDDGRLRWTAIADLEGTPPLGKLGAILFVFGASVAKAVQTLRGRLAVCSQELYHAGVQLNAWNDSPGFQELDEWGTCHIIDLIIIVWPVFILSYSIDN